MKRSKVFPTQLRCRKWWLGPAQTISKQIMATKKRWRKAVLIRHILDKCFDYQSTNFPGVPRSQKALYSLRKDCLTSSSVQRHTPELHDLGMGNSSQMTSTHDLSNASVKLSINNLRLSIPNPNTSLFKSIAWTGCMSKSNSAALHLPLPSLPVVLLSLSHCASSRADRKSQVRQFWVCVQLIHRQR